MRVPIAVRVRPISLPKDQRLKVTNWCNFENVARYHGAELFSLRYWDLVRLYAENMAAYRQNVILAPLWRLIDFRAGADDRLEYGFERLDLLLDIFRESGVIGWVEGAHLGARDGGWYAEHFFIHTRRVEDGRVVAGRARPGTPEAESFLASFLPALQAHLDRRGLAAVTGNTWPTSRFRRTPPTTTRWSGASGATLPG